MDLNRQKYNWWVDALLLLVFIVAYELDFTGLPLHQWLGIAAGALSLYHLILHWNWIKTVTVKYSTCSNFRTRLCYLLDVGLLLTMILTIGSGVLISTWLNLAFQDFFLWRDLHVVFSILTLLTASFKIMLHWRWIVSVSKQKLVKNQVANAKPATASAIIGRGDFIKMMGLISAATGVVLFSILHEDSMVEDVQASTGQPVDSVEPSSQISSLQEYIEADTQAVEPLEAAAVEQIPAETTALESGETQIAEVDTPVQVADTAVVPTEVPTEIPTEVPTEFPTTAPTATTAAVAGVALVCTASCRKNKNCSYPGKCREYIDLNQNGLCDLGECV